MISYVTVITNMTFDVDQVYVFTCATEVSQSSAEMKQL